MIVSALPTGPTAGAVYLVLIVIVVAVWLLISARIWPWTRCQHCGGTGKRRSPSGRYWRVCPRCDGGVRRRPGAGR